MRKVIIIGASSGIGEELAKYYAKSGCMVGISARREENLKSIASEFGGNVIYLTMDVSYNFRDSEGMAYGVCDGFNELVSRLGGVDLIIYSSGYGKQASTLQLEQEVSTILVNVQGFVSLVTQAINYFSNSNNVSKFTPQIVVISSVASIKGMGIAASYSASKRFQLAYFDGLSQMVRKSGIKISLTSILPGFVATNFISGRRYPFTMECEYAAKKIVRAIEKRKFWAVIDWKWAIIVSIWRLIPNFVWRRIKL